jgi:hypothetical protein
MLIKGAGDKSHMSLRNRIPEQLRLRDEMVAITIKNDVEVFPTTEYILLEISPNAGRVDIPKISNTIRDLVKGDKRMVAIRGYGFKGVGLSVRVAHELKKKEKRFVYEMTFDTFEAADPETDRPLTSVQIIIMPPV